MPLFQGECLDMWTKNISSWWFQPIWKMLVKMGSSSPIFGVKIKKIWVATTQILCHPNNRCFQKDFFLLGPMAWAVSDCSALHQGVCCHLKRQNPVIDLYLTRNSTKNQYRKFASPHFDLNLKVFNCWFGKEIAINYNSILGSFRMFSPQRPAMGFPNPPCPHPPQWYREGFPNCWW